MKAHRKSRMKALQEEIRRRKYDLFYKKLTPATSEANLNEMLKDDEKLREEFKHIEVREDDITQLQLNELELVKFEVGFTKEHNLKASEILEVKRMWTEHFLTEWYTDYSIFDIHWSNQEGKNKLIKEAPAKVTEALRKLSDATISELRDKVYKEKYWNHIEAASYSYISYFRGLLSAYFKGEKPSSLIAKDVNFEELFSPEALQELKTALPVKIT